MPERPLRLALVIGEESGDQIGAGLIDAIRRERPGAVFVGVAGPRMQARGMRSFFPVDDVAVMGLGAVVAHLPRIGRRIYEERADEAASTGAVTVGVACPYCLILLDDCERALGGRTEVL